MNAKFLQILICASLTLAASQTRAENTTQKQKNIHNKIEKTNSKLKNSRSVSKKLGKNVRIAEDKLHKISRELHKTEKKINKLTSKLNKSNTQKTKLLEQTDQQKAALAQQMQALYTSGKQSHLRLLLKQNDPSDISRTIKYFEYLNKHRLKRIKAIKTQLDKVKNLQVQINTDTQQLNDLKSQQSKKKLSLKKAVRNKEKALKNQKKVVFSQQKKLKKLLAEESYLKGVIQQLTKKREAEEKRRKAAKIAKKATSNNKTKTKKKKAKLALTKRYYVPDKPFPSLKGKLPWPVRGKLIQRFGTSKNSRQKWKGVILSAPAGSNVHAVARGKVEFSGRLKGYGYLVIIRHDNNYRSLYAYNRSVYKKEGQIVNGGEIIAAVGSTGGQSNSGLYFEIRRGTSHQNPSRWCR